MEGKNKIALTFAFYQGDQVARRETVAQDIVKVGKDPNSHLRVEDDAASRMHAVIEVQDEITLIDLGSETGTLVNGARVNKCRLNPGDQIQIGNTVIVLESVSDTAAAVAATPAAAAAVGGVPAPVGSVPAPAGSVPAPAAAVAAAVAVPAVASSVSEVPAPPGMAPNPFSPSGGASNPFAVGAGGGLGASNPFAAQAAGGVAAAAPEGSYEYQMIKNGAEVPSDETDGVATAIEVRILWGRNVLKVDHLSPPRAFYVGTETGQKGQEVDYDVPEEKLGSSRAPIVLADGSGGGSVVLLPGVVGTIEVGGQPKMSIQEAIQAGKCQPCAEVSGAHQLVMTTGTAVRMDLKDLTFEVSAVATGKKIAGAFTVAAMVSGGAALYVIGSFIGHAGLLGAMAMFMPPLGSTGDDALSEEQRFLIKQYLDSAAEKELEEEETEQLAEDDADNREGGTGTKAKGEEGAMGNPTTDLTGNRYGVKGPADNQDMHLARQSALRDAAEFGMIGLLNSGAGGDPDAPTAIWGEDDSLGSDPLSAQGNMWGDSIGESFGAGGLGLSGIGEGGGGRGEGIGLGSIGTLGHGAGTGTGQGFGSGHGRLGRSHRARPPRVRMGSTNVSGRLPPEVIQRIVRQNFGRFRLCYENALRNNPNLQGRVTVRFVISRAGTVSSVSGGGDIPDGSVISCVTQAFYGLSFPQPEGGIVTVAYPIVFTPSG